MRRHWMVLSALGLMTLASVALAGGRARIEVSQAPKQVVAGQEFDLAIVVIPESWSHRRNVQPLVVAECGDRMVKTSAVALKRVNRYQATLALPSPGAWTIRVDSRYCETVMSPLAIEAVAAKPAAAKS